MIFRNKSFLATIAVFGSTLLISAPSANAGGLLQKLKDRKSKDTPIVIQPIQTILPVPVAIPVSQPTYPVPTQVTVYSSSPWRTVETVPTTTNYVVNNIEDWVPPQAPAPTYRPRVQERKSKEVVLASAVSKVATQMAYGKPDLVLEDIHLEAPATLAAGPAYRVQFRNQGSVAANHFQVALVASVDGQINDDSPRVMVDVPMLESNRSVELTLRLPIQSLRMVSANGTASEFNVLYAAVDAQDEVQEMDENNNTAGVERAALEGNNRR